MRHPRLLACVLALASACGGATTTYTRSSSQGFAAKVAGCPLEALSVPPQRAFVELGSFDFRGTPHPHTMAEVLERVAARACQEGADAVIARPGGNNYYVQATALRWTDADPSITVPAAPVR